MYIKQVDYCKENYLTLFFKSIPLVKKKKNTNNRKVITLKRNIQFTIENRIEIGSYYR